MKSLFLVSGLASLFLFACSSTNSTVGSGAGNGNDANGNASAEGGAGGDGGQASANGNDGGSSSSSDGSMSGGDVSNVMVSSAAGPLTFGSCPAFNACGGSLDGTWDYTGGCLDDPFAAVKQQCPTATTKNESGSVTGTVNILGNAVYRKATAQFTGTVTLPVACTMGASCTQVQAAVASAAPGATCASDGAGGCDCTVTTTKPVDSTTTFTQSGNTITTADGNTYDVCVQGNKLSEHQTNANAAEPGAFDLTKR